MKNDSLSLTLTDSQQIGLNNWKAKIIKEYGKPGLFQWRITEGVSENHIEVYSFLTRTSFNLTT